MLIKIANVAPGAAKAGDGPAPQGALAPDLSPRGHFDGVANGVAFGWAFDPSRPAARLTVELWREDERIASGLADAERLDVRDHGLGDGRHGFLIPLPELPPQSRPIALVARIAGAGVALGRVEIEGSGRTRLHGRILELVGPLLRLEFIADAPFSERPAVEVSVDGVGFAALDLPALAAGERWRAEARLPDSALDGAGHWVRLAFADTGAPLADDVLRTPFAATTEQALRAYAFVYPGAVSLHAQRRYAALERQLAALPATLARGGALSAPALVAQLHHVHRQVVRGPLGPMEAPAPLVAPAPEAPQVSVVLAARDRFPALYATLAALLLAPNAASFEIVVVDDASADRTRELGKIVANLRLLRNAAPQGFVKSVNRGAAAARGTYVAVLEAGAEPGPGWLDEMLFSFAQFPDAGLVGAKLLYPDGRIQAAGGGLTGEGEPERWGRHRNPHHPDFNYAREVAFVPGVGLMAPRELWARLGGFDEGFAPGGYLDADLAFRARGLGRRAYYAPFAEIVRWDAEPDEPVRPPAPDAPRFDARWRGAAARRPAPAPQAPLRALVIDYQTPQPDKDAGGYAAVQEMQLLQALGFELTFAPRSLAWAGAYTQDLQRRGVECLHAPFTTAIEDVIARRGPEFDIVYITRYSVAEAYIPAIRAAAPRAKIVFCNADLHFLREIREALALGDADGLSRAKATREAELAVMRAVDVTLTYSDTEAAVILSHNLDASKVARCPWVVEVEGAPPPFSARAGLAFLGGFQHPPNEDAVRWFVGAVMPELRRALPGVKLHVYGSHMGERVQALASADVIVEGYVERVEDVYDRHRLFVAPLRAGAGLKGKVVGALAAGAPTILSPVAAEGIGLSRGVEAMVAETPAEWARAAAALYGDEARWREMSARAQDFARRNFSFARGLETMRAALALAGVYVGEAT